MNKPSDPTVTTDPLQTVPHRLAPPSDTLAWLQRPPSIQVKASRGQEPVDRGERINRLFAMVSNLHGVCLASRGWNDLLNRACEAVVETGACQLACFNWAQAEAPPDDIAGIQSAGLVAGLGPDLTAQNAIIQSAAQAALNHSPSVWHGMPAQVALGDTADELRSAGFRSWASFPISSNGRLIGVMSLLHHFSDAFGPDEVLLLRRWTHDLGAALAHENTAVERLFPCRPQLDSRLHQALARDEVVLHYRPMVDTGTGELRGLQALPHWNHPERGPLPPSEFAKIVEESGRAHELGAWALKCAATDRRRWTDQGLEAPRVTVTIPASQLGCRDFVRTVVDALELDTSPHGIDLEISESALVDGFKANIDKLDALRAIGVGMSLNGFGTGRSALAHLARLPVQGIKIDRAFISAMTHGPDHLTLVASIISLAHALRLQVVAEGVETEEERAMLGWLQCDQIQGHLVSTAIPWEGVTRMLRDRPG